MFVNSLFDCFGCGSFFRYGFVTFTTMQARDDLLKKVIIFDDSQS